MDYIKKIKKLKNWQKGVLLGLILDLAGIGSGLIPPKIIQFISTFILIPFNIIGTTSYFLPALSMAALFGVIGFLIDNKKAIIKYYKKLSKPFQYWVMTSTLGLIGYLLSIFFEINIPYLNRVMVSGLSFTGILSGFMKELFGEELAIELVPLIAIVFGGFFIGWFTGAVLKIYKDRKQFTKSLDYSIKNKWTVGTAFFLAFFMLNSALISAGQVGFMSLPFSVAPFGVLGQGDLWVKVTRSDGTVMPAGTVTCYLHDYTETQVERMDANSNGVCWFRNVPISGNVHNLIVQCKNNPMQRLRERVVIMSGLTVNKYLEQDCGTPTGDQCATKRCYGTPADVWCVAENGAKSYLSEDCNSNEKCDEVSLSNAVCNDNPLPQNDHYACVNNYCQLVVGDGIDECTPDRTCGGYTPTTTLPPQTTTTRYQATTTTRYQATTTTTRQGATTTIPQSTTTIPSQVAACSINEDCGTGYKCVGGSCQLDLVLVGGVGVVVLLLFTILTRPKGGQIPFIMKQ